MMLATDPSRLGMGRALGAGGAAVLLTLLEVVVVLVVVVVAAAGALDGSPPPPRLARSSSIMAWTMALTLARHKQPRTNAWTFTTTFSS